MNIIISGNPQPLKRHRHTRSGHTYNSQRDLMDQTSFIVKSQWLKKPYSTPLSLSLKFFMPIPKRSPKKMLGTPHYKRPDIDNLIKFILDSLNGVLWIDDSIISELTALKLYDSNPRTEIEINRF